MAERHQLPYIEFTNFLGLNTKSSNEILQPNQLRVSKNTDFLTQYGAVSKPAGSTRVLSSIYQENSVTQEVPWLGLYKSPDLDGQILRDVIVAAGTKLHKLSSGALTALTGSGLPVTEARTASLFHSAAQYADFLLIQNQDPDLVGKGNTPVKYDGVEIHKWGITPPGSVETVQESFATASSFTVSGGTASNESTTTQDGAATKFSKTSTTQVNGDLLKLITSFSVDTTIADRAFVFLYIPRGQLPKFADTQAVQIYVGSNTTLTTNYYRFDIDTGSLIEGWNQLFLNFKSPTASVGTPVATALQTVQFSVNSKTAATTITSLRWDTFTTYDLGTTVVEVGKGSIFANSSTYTYKVSFASKYGHESNAGPATPTVTALASGPSEFYLKSIPTSADPQVFARKIWRTVNGGTLHQLVTTIPDNTTTRYTDTTADTALSQVSPPLAGDVSDDNSPPVKAGIVKVWKRTVLLAGKPDNPNTVFWSEDNEPESFPTLNEATLDGKITAIYETYSGLVVETENGKWQITGDNPDFTFNKLINQIGCVGRRAAGETRILGWATDRDGMRLYDLNNVYKISETIRDKFEDDFNQANIELMHTFHSKDRNLIGVFVADSSGDYKGNNYVYQYPLDDVDKGWWWQLDLPSSINLLHVSEIEDSDGDLHLYAGGDDGMIYEIFNSSAKNWVLSTGSTEAITTTLTTKFFRPGEAGIETEGVSGRVAPRFIELRKKGTDATTWVATIDTANGPAQTTVTSTQSVTIPFAANESILRYPIPPMQAAEYMRLKLTNSDASVATTLIGVRLYFHVQPGQFPIFTGDLGG